MTLEKFSWSGEPAQVDARAETPRHWRPSTRADCEMGPRPCPYVGCRHHLAMHVDGDGSISRSGGRGKGTRTLDAMLARGGSVDEWGDSVVDVIETMGQTCSLDVAGEGGTTHDEVGQLLGVSRPRVIQIEADGLANLRRRIGADALLDLLEAISSRPHLESAMVEVEGHASLEPGDVSAMREAKG